MENCLLYAKKHLSVLAAILVLSLVSMLFTGCLAPPVDGGGCAGKYPEVDTITEIRFLPNPDITLGPNDDLAFELSNWCHYEFSLEDSCRCKWKVWSLDFGSNSSIPWGDSVHATIVHPTVDGNVAYPYTFLLDSTGTWEGDTVMIFEGTVLLLNFLNEIDSAGVFLQPGGLCVVENVDGGDPDNRKKH